MNLDGNTIQVLKNFAEINRNFLVKPGNVLRIMSLYKTIVAEAEVDVEFPVEFGIYDLHQFLETVALFGDTPTLDFGDHALTITGHQTGHRSARHFYVDVDVIESAYPSKRPAMPDPDVSFSLSADMLDQFYKAAKVVKVPDVLVSDFGTEDDVYLALCEKAIDTSITLEQTMYSECFSSANTGTNASFSLFLKLDNLKLMPGDYEVALSSKGIAEFRHSSRPLVYWIAVEADSTFTPQQEKEQ